MDGRSLNTQNPGQIVNTGVRGLSTDLFKEASLLDDVCHGLLFDAFCLVDIF